MARPERLRSGFLGVGAAVLAAYGVVLFAAPELLGGPAASRLRRGAA